MRAPFVVLALVAATLLPICCSPPEFRFEPVSEGNCGDRIKNGKETDRDCGGPQCGKCSLGSICRSNVDCENGACFANKCQAQHCTNSMPDAGETDADCGGGECPGCLTGQVCVANTDCRQNLCENGQCVPTTCDNDDKDGNETDVDCGGDACAPCGNGKRCSMSGDCIEGACRDGFCVSMQCANAVLDEGEEGVDCGGTCPLACNPDITCMDKMPSVVETDVDCGGPCMPCENGKRCIDATDCVSEYCLNATCQDDPCIAAGTCGAGGAGGAGGTGSAGEGGEPPVATGGMDTGGTGSGGAPSQTGGAAPMDGGEPSGGTSGGTPPVTGGASTGGAATGGAATGGAATGGAPPAEPLTRCTGCARLFVPLAKEDDSANFAIPLSQIANFGGALVTARVYRERGTGGSLRLYVQYSGNPNYSQLIQAEDFLLEDLPYRGWTTIPWDVGAQPAQNFDKGNVGRVGIRFTGEPGTEWEDTLVYVDYVRVSGSATIQWNFDAMGSVGAESSTGTPNVMFLNNGDDPVDSAVLGWLGGG